MAEIETEEERIIVEAFSRLWNRGEIQHLHEVLVTSFATFMIKIVEAQNKGYVARDQDGTAMSIDDMIEDLSQTIKNVVAAELAEREMKEGATIQ